MTAKPAPPASSRETWLDWIPTEAAERARQAAEPLLTREELLAALRDPNVVADDPGVTARDLASWQAAGVIPYPIRRWHEGATRALYPRWMVDIVVTLRRQQAEGKHPRELGPLMRDHVRHLLRMPSIPEEQARLDELARRGDLDHRLAALSEPLAAAARALGRLSGRRITSVEVAFHDEQGGTHVERYPVPDAREPVAP